MRMNITAVTVKSMFLLCVLCLGLICSFSYAQDAPAKLMKVVLKDGRVLEGEVDEHNGKVDIKTSLGVITVKKSEVTEMTEAVAPVAAYNARRKKVSDDDYKGLYSLARWAWGKHRNDPKVLELARGDLETALQVKPDYQLAKLLLKQVNAKLKGSPKAKQPAAHGGTTIKPIAGGIEPVDKSLVNEQDMYWIRLMEFRPGDKVGVTFTNNALNRYVESMKGDYAGGWDKIGKERQFRALPSYRKVAEILRFKENDTALLRDIQIKRDPGFMLDFRSRIWPMVRQYCASADCHGGPDVKGGLKFYVLKGNNKALYTNFIILSGTSFSYKQMIDRSDPERSLLVQYLLNPKVATDVHPKVRGASINYAFPNINAGTYKRMISWIRDLKSPAPNYHLQWTPPAGMTVNTSGKPMLPKAALNQDQADKLKEDKDKEKGNK